MCLFADRLYTSSLCAVRVVSTPRASSTTTLCAAACDDDGECVGAGSTSAISGCKDRSRSARWTSSAFVTFLNRITDNERSGKACVRFGGRES